uniref:FCP1 homology domain-containing protein n=1 Tax=Palpitomonas bilix TaxID=652834 RepID=A0A7S3LUS7_9EUKA|mmetsp:Transcript_48035/g.124772  ORF Transcript_48035/g.124772 Transcript_48035/m.124772 type:complete len:509 (+) Transcript_48035:312-1838(+)
MTSTRRERAQKRVQEEEKKLESPSQQELPKSLSDVRKLAREDAAARGAGSSPIFSAPQTRSGSSKLLSPSFSRVKEMEKEGEDPSSLVANLSKQMETASSSEHAAHSGTVEEEEELFSPHYSLAKLKQNEKLKEVEEKAEAALERVIADANVPRLSPVPKKRRKLGMGKEGERSGSDEETAGSGSEEEEREEMEEDKKKERETSEEEHKKEEEEAGVDEESTTAMEIDQAISETVGGEKTDGTCKVESTGKAEEGVSEQQTTQVEEEEETVLSTEEFNQYALIAALPMLTVQRSQISVPCLPPKAEGSPPVTIVLDLDETLVHATTQKDDRHDIMFDVEFGPAVYNVYVKKRPRVMEFLRAASSMFEVVVFTASQKVYADRLLDILDKDTKYIEHRLFRDSCVIVEGNYLKDLTVLGRDMSKVFIIDNSPVAFGLQVDNGIPIESWYDDQSDIELDKMLPFLRELSTCDDVRPLIRQHYCVYKKVGMVRKQLDIKEVGGETGEGDEYA